MQKNHNKLKLAVSQLWLNHSGICFHYFAWSELLNEEHKIWDIFLNFLKMYSCYLESTGQGKSPTEVKKEKPSRSRDILCPTDHIHPSHIVSEFETWESRNPEETPNLEETRISMLWARAEHHHTSGMLEWDLLVLLHPQGRNISVQVHHAFWAPNSFQLIFPPFS